MPGLYDSHTHTKQSILRGLWTIPRRQRSRCRFMIAQPLLRSMTSEDTQTAMELACLEYIKAGVVGFCDWGHMPSMVEEVAKIVEKAGIRASLGMIDTNPRTSVSPMTANEYGQFLERAGTQKKFSKKDLNKYLQVLSRIVDGWHGAGDGRIQI